MSEVNVYCGGLKPGPNRRGPAILLDAAAPDGAPGKVNLHLDDITRSMARDIPDRLADLLEISAYVYCADQFCRRDTPAMNGMGARWRRRFRFHVPVSDIAFWTLASVLEALGDTLGFLSEDQYQFEFTRSERPAGIEPYLDLDGSGAPAGFDPDRIVLFSGGLDSFAGAAEALLNRGERLALVSHQSSPFVRSKQVDLVDALRQRSNPGQLFHVSVVVNKGPEEAREYTQRSRSFLFATLGFVLARMFRKAEIVFFENGVVSLNLPVAEHVLGSRSTRTTHPQVLAGLNRLFSLVAVEPFRVENPYFWLTKADVLQRIADAGCGDLIGRTFSCARVREATQQKRHCGVCSQCIDRRFGILAAGLGHFEPAEIYGVDLFTGERQPGPDLTLAESYVLTAGKFAGAGETGFLARYGQVYRAASFLEGGSPAQNVAWLHQLHQRHGKAVMGVVSARLSEHATLEKTLALPATCLLSMMQTQMPMQPAFVDPVEAQPAASKQAIDTCRPELQRPIRLALDRTDKRVVFVGGPAISGKGFQLIEILFVQFTLDQESNRVAADYQHLSSDKLATQLGIAEQSLRQVISRARKAIAAQFQDMLGVKIDDDDVVQNTGWQGYRLNPYLVFQPLALIVGSTQPQPGGCHNSEGRMSQLFQGSGPPA